MDEIKKRNPVLQDAKFNLPTDSDRPFPIVGATLIGPTDGSPFYTGKPNENANYTFLEFTPMYIGHMKAIDVDYKYSAGFKHTKRVGGVLESFAFPAKGSSPVLGLKESESTALLNVPAPTAIMDLARSISGIK